MQQLKNSLKNKVTKKQLLRNCNIVSQNCNKKLPMIIIIIENNIDKMSGGRSGRPALNW